MPIVELTRGLRAAIAENPGPLTLDGSRSYLIGEQDAVLLDPGPPGAEQQALLHQLIAGAHVQLLCLTHAHGDHAGAALAAAARLGCRIGASADTLARLGVTGEVLADGASVPVDGGATRLRVLTTPGHSRDHLCYVWLPSRAVFTGDLVLGEGTTAILHPDGDVDAYLASLERLRTERPRRFFPGHGSPVEDPKARLREHRVHRLAREQQIVAAMAGGADSVPAIIRQVYGDLSGVLGRAASASVRAHLARLESHGRNVPAMEGYPCDPTEPTGRGEEG